jgi:hypothetical protein
MNSMNCFLLGAFLATLISEQTYAIDFEPGRKDFAIWLPSKPTELTFGMEIPNFGMSTTTVYTISDKLCTYMASRTEYLSPMDLSRSGPRNSDQQLS